MSSRILKPILYNAKLPVTFCYTRTRSHIEITNNIHLLLALYNLLDRRPVIFKHQNTGDGRSSNNATYDHQRLAIAPFNSRKVQKFMRRPLNRKLLLHSRYIHAYGRR